VVLFEASQKRGAFLRAAIAGLALDRVRLVNERAERHPPLGCDIVASRLTGRIDGVLEAAAPHIRPGGRLVLYKTRICQPELDRAAPPMARLGLSVTEQRDVPLPDCGITRRFVVVARPL
jgi:16S rRNA G527 N7-methylase RsmG